MSKYIELNQNLDILKLNKIMEILPSTLDDASKNEKPLVDILYDLTKAEDIEIIKKNNNLKKAA